MTFESDKTIAYWADSSAYDLETGATLLRSKKYPYALFFGHLAIEKILKALVVKHTGTHAPYSHSLVMLAKKTGFEIQMKCLTSWQSLWNFTQKRGILM